ncbi:MAG: hypothetical protein SVO01_00760 [Thermotogota bacterium]|nr:hypothetical protein [Thermotogota bacterium]
MPLMDRIYIKSFLEMSYPEQAALIDKVRTIRTSALNAAKVSSQRITKSAMRNISKAKGTKRGKKMLKDPTIAAKKALEKLSPEQIALLKNDFKNL